MNSQIEFGEIKSEERTITADELEAEIDALDEPVDELVMRNVPYQEREAKRQALLREFVEKQIKEKNKYKNIFRTKQGSLYFVLPTGESLRVKQRGEVWKMQPICEKIFYVEDDQGKKLQDMLGRDTLQHDIIGMPIQTTSCTPGVTPIEFGIRHLPKIHFNEEPGKITIQGDHMKVFASGYHQGHRIAEIIK